MFKEALKQALELIRAWERGCDSSDYGRDIQEALEALEEALAQPQGDAQMTQQYIITEEQLVVLKAAITMGALVIENGTIEEHEAFNKGFDTLQSLPELTHQPLQPITAEAVTDELLKDIFPDSASALAGEISVNSRVRKDIADVFNAVIKHRGDTK